MAGKCDQGGSAVVFQDLLRQLGEAVSRGEDVENIKSLLGKYQSNRSDWEKYAKFDPRCYTRNLVDRGNGLYNVIVLCWGESQGSKIHDHSGSECYVKVLEGSLKETMYDLPDLSQPQMNARPSTVYPKDGVTHINDSVGLHRMENPSHTDPAVTLHVYVPGFGECKTYDDVSGQQATAKMTFYSEFGETVTTDKNPLGGKCEKDSCCQAPGHN